MSEKKKIWMVRLGGHVCGPYETVVIESLLQDQKITEIDEVALPCKGWEFVRDRGEFLDALEKLRSNSFNKMASSLDTLNVTQVGVDDKTEKVTGSEEDTQTLPVIDFNQIKTVDKKQQFLTNIKNIKNNNKESKIAFVFVSVIIVILCAFFINVSGYTPSTLINGVGQEDFNQAWFSGDYAKALKILKGNKRLKNKNRLEYASVLLMAKNKFTGVEQVLESSKYKDSAKWKNLKGLWHHYSGERDVAESSYLNALKKDPGDVPSLVNLGFLYRDKGAWSEARSYFESAFVKAPSKGFDGVEFYLFESWMMQKLADNGLIHFDKIQSNLQNKMVGPSTYKYEFKLIEIWLAVTNKRLNKQNSWRIKIEELLKLLLELDPAILVKRFSNPYIYNVQPGSLSYLCDDLNEKLNKSKNKDAVIGLCFIVDKKYDEASIALSSTAQTEHVLVLRSFVEQLKNNFENANEYLSKAMDLRGSENSAKFFFQARFCFQKGDMKCSAEYWMKALENNSDSYTALTGLGLSYFQVGDFEKARSFSKRASKFVNSYGPLIDLQTSLKKVN